jgi:hypothetical protein
MGNYHVAINYTRGACLLRRYFLAGKAPMPSETTRQVQLHQAIALGVVRAITEVMDSRLPVVHNTFEDTTANTQKIGDFLSSL